MSQPFNESAGTGDVWSDWLLKRRQGDNAEYQKVVAEDVRRIRDRVLDGAALRPGMTLADLGSGEGLIPFGAIERVGSSLRVIVTDISAPMLRHTEALARQRGVGGQCSFIQCSAEKLAGVADASVDVVTSRAVLAYVQDKRAAFREIFRVLKPGGRLSLAEPIRQDQAFEAATLGKVIAMQPDHPDIAFLRLLHRFKSAQYPSTEAEISRHPMVNYSERDLVGFANEIGMVAVHLELHIDVQPSAVKTWDVFLGISLHPWAPTGGEILAKIFNESERAYFEKCMRPMVESGKIKTMDAIAYLTANRPG